MNAQEALCAGWFEAADCRPLGTGHINDTYLVGSVAGSEQKSAARFVLQRVNRHVFKDPRIVESNVARVVAHIAARAPGFVPEIIPSRAAQPGFRDSAGEYWRLWRFVENARAYDAVENLAMARAAGAAFGRFQLLLGDLPGAPLEPAIPGFLELAGYLEHYDQVRDNLALSSTASAADGSFADFITARRSLASVLATGEDYIHGDCKLNNLLFGGVENTVVCVVDLDTVMRGHWAWDFGDLARSALSNSQLDPISVFSALAEGFLQAGKTRRSVDELVIAPRYVAFMLGVRFLTDHLAGDKYFKVEHHGANLERARVQFELVERFESLDKKLRRAATALVQALPRQ